jgi:hypothetical protein
MRHLTIAAIAMILLAATAPAQAGIRTDNGGLQNPNAITVLQTEAGQPAPDAKAG